MGFRRPLFVATLFVAAIALTGFGVTVGQQQLAVSLMNQTRGPGAAMSQNGWLTDRATAHAESMRDSWVAAGCPATRPYLRHVSNLSAHYQPAQVHRSWSRIGENVGVIGVGSGGLDLAMRELHNAYMASPGHRANIVDRRYSTVGVGVVTGPTPAQQAGGACPGVAADSVLWNAQVFVAAPVK